MFQIFTFARKEFQHIGRDWRSLSFLIGLPIVQMIIFGFALSNEIREAPFAVLDQSGSSHAAAIIRQLDASPYLSFVHNLNDLPEGHRYFRRNKIQLAVIFPVDFEQALLRGEPARVQLMADASDPNLGSSLNTYATAIINDYQQQLQGLASLPFPIGIETRMLYNPLLKSAFTFVPGVMTLILMLISAMMTAVAIVREKELGTMEVMLVSPAEPLAIALSKMIPYLLISFVNLANILLLSYYLLEVPLRGSLALLLLVCGIYLISSLALGLLISTITDSQQVALFVSLIGLMLPTLLFSGFMFPIENMPRPMQVISHVVPARWFFHLARDIMIKGLGWSAVWRDALVLAGMAALFLAISVRRFKLRLE